MPSCRARGGSRLLPFEEVSSCPESSPSPCLLLALVSATALTACSGAADDAQATTSTSDQSALEAARRRAPSCHDAAACLKAFDDGTWKVSQSQQDACVANHDFPDICVSCNTARHVCEYHSGF